MYSSLIVYDIGTHGPRVSKRAKVGEFHFPTVVYIYSGIPISRTLGFPNLPISRTKPCFPWICFTQALQFYITPDFSSPRFLETPDNSNLFWLPRDKLTLDNSNLRKFPNHLVRMSITFTPLKCQFDENWHQFFPHFFAQNNQFNRKTFFDVNKIGYNHSSGREKLLRTYEFPVRH